MTNFEDLEYLVEKSDKNTVFIFFGMTRDILQKNEIELKSILETLRKKNKARIILFEELLNKKDLNLGKNIYIGYKIDLYKNVNMVMNLIINENNRSYMYKLINMNPEKNIPKYTDKIEILDLYYDDISMYYKCYKHTDEHESRKRLTDGKVNYSYPVKHKLSDNEICTKRWKVYSQLEKKYGKHIETTDKNLIVDAFNLIDENFFNNYLMKQIKKLGFTLNFKWSNKMTKSAGILYKRGNNCIIKISGPIFSGLFKNFENNFLKHNNIHCSDRLSCFIITLEHEIIHLLMKIAPDIINKGNEGIYSSHGTLFKELVAAIFNHNGSTHHLLMRDKDDEVEENFLVGDRIFLEKIEKYGYVTKINKKTVRIRMDDGLIYKASPRLLKKAEDYPKKTENVLPSIGGYPAEPDKISYKIGDRVIFNYKGTQILATVSKINKTTVLIILDDDRLFKVSPALLKPTNQKSSKTPIVTKNFFVGEIVKYKTPTGESKGRVLKVNPVNLVVLDDDKRTYSVPKLFIKPE